MNHAVHPIHIEAVANQNTILAEKAQKVPENYAISRDIIMDSPPMDRITKKYHPEPSNEQEQAMWDGFDGNYEFEANLYCDKQKRKDFNRCMEEYSLWAGLEALPDNDMINIEQIWQEDEQDD